MDSADPNICAPPTQLLARHRNVRARASELRAQQALRSPLGERKGMQKGQGDLKLAWVSTDRRGQCEGLEIQGEPPFPSCLEPAWEPNHGLLSRGDPSNERATVGGATLLPSSRQPRCFPVKQPPFCGLPRLRGLAPAHLRAPTSHPPPHSLRPSYTLCSGFTELAPARGLCTGSSLCLNISLQRSHAWCLLPSHVLGDIHVPALVRPSSTTQPTTVPTPHFAFFIAF